MVETGEGACPLPVSPTPRGDTPRSTVWENLKKNRVPAHYRDTASYSIAMAAPLLRKERRPKARRSECHQITSRQDT